MSSESLVGKAEDWEITQNAEELETLQSCKYKDDDVTPCMAHLKNRGMKKGKGQWNKEQVSLD